MNRLLKDVYPASLQESLQDSIVENKGFLAWISVTNNAIVVFVTAGESHSGAEGCSKEIPVLRPGCVPVESPTCEGTACRIDHLLLSLPGI